MTNPFKVGMRVIAIDEAHETAEFGDGEVIDIDGDCVLVTFGTDEDGADIEYWIDGRKLGIVRWEKEEPTNA